ncbi:hypothetical protein [Xanthomonas sacchari]|uniref:hypothetical protein n=1 Tax=Xanthomonas sacchari TaxID=56458 RepID=UPI00225E6665|nr:hypothetical protein [Xanthomonas sacchari]
MDKTSIAHVANAMRVCESLSKILRSLDAIKSRTGRADFVTRRYHNLAMDALFCIDLDRMTVGDLDRAFLDASIGDDASETPDQHACRYLAQVLSIARSLAAANPLGERCTGSQLAETWRPQ